MWNRIIIISLFLCLNSLNGVAQIGEPRNNWVVGGGIGVNANQVLFTPTIRQNYAFGPSIGVTARYTSEKYFNMLCSVQFELNFTQAGWKEDVYSASSEKLQDSYRRTIGYLQLPLLAHLGFGAEHRGFKGFLLLGPQLGYALYDKEYQSAIWTTTTLSDGTVVPDRSNSVFQQYGKSIERRFDYGIAVGLGTEYSSKIGHFTIDFRYYYGLGDIFNNAKRDPFSRSANNALMLKLTYLVAPRF